MIHLGDITKLKGSDVPVCDCIIGGSPCQDLSVAGKRVGLAGQRSGLFMEQIRLIKEMRKEDESSGRSGFDVRPRFMVWENVIGAFSSNKGEDFRAVLEETIRIKDPSANVPRPEKGKWEKAGAILGDGYSVTWRVLDGQFFGVPQRRKRIALVADFGGQSAPEIQFKPESLFWNPKKSRIEGGEATTGGTSSGSGDGMQAHFGVVSIEGNGSRPSHLGDGYKESDVMYTLNTTEIHGVAYGLGRASFNAGQNAKFDFSILEDKIPTLTAMGPGAVCVDTSLLHHADCLLCAGSGQANAEMTDGSVATTLHCLKDRPYVVLDTEDSFESRTHILEMQHASEVIRYDGDTCPTLQSRMGTGGNNVPLVFKPENLVVRRLTPLECERLQGYPDGWTDIGDWVDSNGKLHKGDSDTPRYKALGNSICVPCWLNILKGISDQYDRVPTLASLFDGIGGFPLLWESINGIGTALWASEIEEFPIAVTKYRFPEVEDWMC